MTKAGSAAVTRLLPRPVQAAVVVLLLLVVLAPVSYIFFASVSSDLSVAAGAYLPHHMDFGNYARMWSTVDLAGGLGNSLLVAGTVAAVCALVSVGTGYVLVRFAFTGRVAILRALLALLALQSIPGTLLLLPVFVLFASAANLFAVQIIGRRLRLRACRAGRGLGNGTRRQQPDDGQTRDHHKSHVHSSIRVEQPRRQGSLPAAIAAVTAISARRQPGRRCSSPCS